MPPSTSSLLAALAPAATLPPDLSHRLWRHDVAQVVLCAGRKAQATKGLFRERLHEPHEAAVREHVRMSVPFLPL